MIKSKFNSIIYTGIILLVFAVIFFLDGLRAPVFTKDGAVGVSFLPLVNVILLIIFTSLLIRNALKRKNVDYNFTLSRIGDPLKILGLTVIFSLTFEKIGFFISTMVYVFLIMLIFEKKKINIIKFLFYSLIITFFIYALFEISFGVRLPKLLLERWL